MLVAVGRACCLCMQGRFQASLDVLLPLRDEGLRGLHGDERALPRNGPVRVRPESPHVASDSGVPLTSRAPHVRTGQHGPGSWSEPTVSATGGSIVLMEQRMRLSQLPATPARASVPWAAIRDPTPGRSGSSEHRPSEDARDDLQLASVKVRAGLHVNDQHAPEQLTPG
jgi:hypothetical protein